ncbi:hypothetical protein EDB81DRAFT_882947 [Dactylonectria macrodidyma]|uniref:Uncharacterized protein n=1 Tax=Dactylonectria macrodidyma TaxID=307937 RepID=A0A9P9EZP5_9HYPO|nr:hypothetical protein EDB81DRAFT_882947 [Dactylonectria macrodidyma]
MGQGHEAADWPPLGGQPSGTLHGREHTLSEAGDMPVPGSTIHVQSRLDGMSKMVYVGPPGCLSTSYLSLTGITAYFFCILWTLRLGRRQEKPPSGGLPLRRHVSWLDGSRTDSLTTHCCFMSKQPRPAGQRSCSKPLKKNTSGGLDGTIAPWLHLLCRHEPQPPLPAGFGATVDPNVAWSLDAKAVAYCHAHGISSALHTNFGGPQEKALGSTP